MYLALLITELCNRLDTMKGGILLEIMKKRILVYTSIIVCILFVAFIGYSKKSVEVKKADFSFELVEGYTYSDITDDSCAIVDGEKNTVVGGIEITNIKSRKLDDNSTTDIMRYLQGEFHKTNDVEFLVSRWGDEDTIVIVNLSKINEALAEKESFYHVFFEKEFAVYHMWFDLSMIDSTMVEQFLSTVAMRND